MVNTIYNRENDFHWTPLNLSVSFIIGVIATAAIWLFTGLLIMLFLL